MEERPRIADTAPIAINFEANEDYYWRRCRHSKNPPYCDSAHAALTASPFPPVLTLSKPSPSARTASPFPMRRCRPSALATEACSPVQ